MKRIGNLFEEIISFDNLLIAYKNARKGRRYEQEVLMFTQNLEDNLWKLHNQLKKGTYQLGRYIKFFVYDPKKRLIMALPFRDRVVQWAIYQVVNPYLDRKYISTSFACRVGYGAHRAIKKLQSFLRALPKNGCYVLKLDVAKYFYRVNHKVLMKMLRHFIKDIKLLDLFSIIINDEEPFGVKLTDHEFCGERIQGVGMPIGNLTSQMFANLYLAFFDWYCKYNLRVKFYLRYMDDVIIVGKTKGYLRHIWNECEKFLRSKLKLFLNNKSMIKTVKQGVDFCGYRAWSTHIKLRKKSALRMKHRIKYMEKQYYYGKISVQDFNNTMTSYNGVLLHCNSNQLRRSVYGSIVLKRKEAA